MIDVYLSIFVVLILSSISVLCLILVAFSGCSKYSILGMLRLISSVFSFECIFSSIIIYSLFSYSDLSISTYIASSYKLCSLSLSLYFNSLRFTLLSYFLFTLCIFALFLFYYIFSSILLYLLSSLFYYFILRSLHSLFLVLLHLLYFPSISLSITFNYVSHCLFSLVHSFIFFSFVRFFHCILFALCTLFFTLLLSIDLFIFFLISLLIESNRVPFDNNEAESELVSGFSTSYSSIYLSILMLSEYFNLIVGSIIVSLMVHLSPSHLISLLLFISIIRCSFLRLKFDDIIYLS